MKFLKIFSLLLVLIFAGCGEDSTESSKDSASEDSTQKVLSIKVGASPVPHARILENIKGDLEANGVKMEIKEFSDYVIPNVALNDNDIDANFHQHQPFLDKMVEEKGLKIVSIAKIHIEPIGFYSKKIKDIKELKDGATIALPNDPSNGGRAFILLHNNGLLKLKDPSNLYATEIDIVENPKKLKFKPMEAAMLPKIIDDVDGAVINSNYTLQANLSSKDALLIESADSPYANILVVRESDKDNEALLKLKEALQSQKTKDFIEANYNGEIAAAF